MKQKKLFKWGLVTIVLIFTAFAIKGFSINSYKDNGFTQLTFPRAKTQSYYFSFHLFNW